MTARLLSLIRFALVLPTTIHLVSCTTSSVLGSRTRHVGTVTAIKECRADAQRVYVVWRLENKRFDETSVVDLKTRNTTSVGRLPASARAVPLVELAGETAALPKSHPLPCLGIWRACSDRPDGPFAPRARWISHDRDFCFNLPAWVADPGKITSGLPYALAEDALLFGAILPASATLSIVPVVGGGAPFPLSPSIGAWHSGGDVPTVSGNTWGVE